MMSQVNSERFWKDYTEAKSLSNSKQRLDSKQCHFFISDHFGNRMTVESPLRSSQSFRE